MSWLLREHDGKEFGGLTLHQPCDVNIQPAATIYSPSTYLGVFTYPCLTQAIEAFYIKLIRVYQERVNVSCVYKLNNLN